MDRRHRQEPERQVDVEAGAPRPMVRQPAAECRTENRSHAPQRGKESLVAAALDRRKDIADDREQHADDHAAADALQSAEDDQLTHAVDRQEREFAGRAAQRRRDDEQDRAEHEERLAAVAIRQARKDRDRHGRRQHVDRRDPRVAVESLQRRDDARLRGADDRLIDGGEQRREQQAGHRADELRPGQANQPRRDIHGFSGRVRHGNPLA